MGITRMEEKSNQEIAKEAIQEALKQVLYYYEGAVLVPFVIERIVAVIDEVISEKLEVHQKSKS